jgi:hypothetical protein
MSWSHLVILGLVTGSASLTAWPDHHIWPKPLIFLGPAGFMQISFFSRTLSWYIKLPRASADRSPPTRKIHTISHQVVVWIWHVGNSVTEGVSSLTWRCLQSCCMWGREATRFGLQLWALFSSRISAFFDTEWVGNIDDRWSTGGLSYFHSGNLPAMVIQKIIHYFLLQHWVWIQVWCKCYCWVDLDSTTSSWSWCFTW